MREGPFRRGNRRVFIASLLAVVFVLCTVQPGMADGQEEGGKEGYVRTVPSSPSLSDMEKGQGWSYNTDYIYVLTQSVRDSSLPGGAKVVVFIPAFIVDTAFLPVALIFGLFGE